MKVSIDHSVCTGHGMCYMSAPDVFTDDEQGYGQVIGDRVVADELAESARHGANSCPERAITVED
ncbi:ferredoxin [Nocardia sp. NBC_00565]|uniref:ferredoxin n=1 Tax=Nocardia sp. NBC_00565 TaxID=2975993 RepID=UPI002E7FCC9C|nr:ferredoxin [Nocardia sp. NBC_00565]WUC05680.1 ferredoxin [Nocardia sp. NBC_00565]